MLASRILAQNCALRAARLSQNCAFHLATQFRSTGSIKNSGSLPLPRFNMSLGVPPTLGRLHFSSSSSQPQSGTSLPIESITPDADSTGKLLDVASTLSPTDFGYLSSLGIDMGWGPSGVVQTMLEAVHSFSGTPWWGTIALSVFLIRGAMFPFYCSMSSNAAKMKEVSPLLSPIAKKARVSQQRGDTMAFAQAQQEMKDVLSRSGVNRLWLLFPITQIPIFYGFYRNLREMADLPVPAFTHDGIAWFTDMAAVDPNYILPTATSVLIALQFGIGGEAGANNLAASMKTILMIVIPCVSFAFTHAWPAGLCWYIFCSTCVGVLQAILLRNSTFRDWMGIYPLSTKPVQNPLPPSNSVNALKIAQGALPQKAIYESSKQIGGQGGFLDKITGGKDEEGTGWSWKKYTDRANERSKESKHKAYEQKRKQRLEEQKKAEMQARSQRRAMAQGKRSS